MRSSIGFGAYDRFGQDIATTERQELYRGSKPIRFARGSVDIHAKGGEGPHHKRYTFEAGMTPLGMIIMMTGGAAFVYFIYRVTGSIFGG